MFFGIGFPYTVHRNGGSSGALMPYWVAFTSLKAESRNVRAIGIHTAHAWDSSLRL
jgi:hypothetical protein